MINHQLLHLFSLSDVVFICRVFAVLHTIKGQKKSTMKTSTILFIDMTTALWKDLRNRFTQSNQPRIFQLRKNLSTLTQGNHSMNIYYYQLKGFWDELSTLKPMAVCGCRPICTCTSTKFIGEEQEE